MTTSSPSPVAAHRQPPTWPLAVALPLALVAVVLLADVVESPKTAYVGVLTAVPFLAAVFGTARQTALVGVVTWLAALSFGLLASDGNVPAQSVRLVFIALAVGGAVLAARTRQRTQRLLLEAELEHALVEKVRREATTDLLTGLLNRRGLAEALDGLDRTGPWSVALGDCDNLKSVNDQCGHYAGDCHLQALSVRLTRALGDGDLVARWAGDEFLVALPLPPQEAAVVMRRVHEQITRDPVVSPSASVDLRITFGIAAWEPGADLEVALKEADLALYRGKAAGGSRVVLSE